MRGLEFYERWQDTASFWSIFLLLVVVAAEFAAHYFQGQATRLRERGLLNFKIVGVPGLVAKDTSVYLDDRKLEHVVGDDGTVFVEDLEPGNYSLRLAQGEMRFDSIPIQVGKRTWHIVDGSALYAVDELRLFKATRMSTSPTPLRPLSDVVCDVDGRRCMLASSGRGLETWDVSTLRRDTLDPDADEPIPLACIDAQPLWLTPNGMLKTRLGEAAIVLADGVEATRLGEADSPRLLLRTKKLLAVARAQQRHGDLIEYVGGSPRPRVIATHVFTPSVSVSDTEDAVLYLVRQQDNTYAATVADLSSGASESIVGRVAPEVPTVDPTHRRVAFFVDTPGNLNSKRLMVYDFKDKKLHDLGSALLAAVVFRGDGDAVLFSDVVDPRDISLVEYTFASSVRRVVDRNVPPGAGYRADGAAYYLRDISKQRGDLYVHTNAPVLLGRGMEASQRPLQVFQSAAGALMFAANAAEGSSLGDIVLYQTDGNLISLDLHLGRILAVSPSRTRALVLVDVVSGSQSYGTLKLVELKTGSITALGEHIRSAQFLDEGTVVSSATTGGSLSVISLHDLKVGKSFTLARDVVGEVLVSPDRAALAYRRAQIERMANVLCVYNLRDRLEEQHLDQVVQFKWATSELVVALRAGLDAPWRPANGVYAVKRSPLPSRALR